MSDIPEVLNSILSKLPDGDLIVSEEDYQAWKANYEQMSESDKVFSILGALSQYLTSGCNASAAVFATAATCTARWCNEKDQEDFLNNF